MKYYKLITGYGAEDYIEIDETELEKAYFCFLEKKDAVFSGGAVRGSRIESIKPDYHRIMGWNRGYKLEALDYEELNNKGVDKKCQLQLSGAKDKIMYLIESKQTHLIGKPVPELSKTTDTVLKTTDTSSLAKRLKI